MSNLYDGLNEQMNVELEAAYIYTTMAAYLDKQGMLGMTAFFDEHVKEEVEHAHKIRDFLRETGYGEKYRHLNPGEGDFSSIVDVFEKALDHENFVTSEIDKLVKQAREEKDQRALNLLYWFVDEQIEEEDLFTGLLERAKRVDGNWGAMYQFDSQISHD